MTNVWDTIRRWRTWLVNTGFAALLVLPDLLNAPEVLAVIPDGYHKYVFVAALFINVLMRPRPAVLPHDPEVKARAADFTGEN